jgi:hypothetical protein
VEESLMLLGRMFGIYDSQKNTKKLSNSINDQRWTFILSLLYVYFNQS